MVQLGTFILVFIYPCPKASLNGQFRIICKGSPSCIQEVETEGSLGEQALISDVEGTWGELTAVVNKLTANLTSQVRSIAKVTKVVALEDLKDTVNGMVARLRALAAEVTRVTLELGSEAKLGGQAHVPDVEGVWLNLVRNGQLNVFLAYGSNYGLFQLSSFVGTVNSMVDQLSAFAFEVTNVALEVGTQVAFINVNVQEEILDLKTTVNSMAAQLGTLANEVTYVSLELRREGILGGQAVLPNFQGMWKVLTDNVNFMAMNLTNQVRSITEVTKAVAGGDLTKTTDVGTEGGWVVRPGPRMLVGCGRFDG
ncbi:hypothetical protein BYT27DRAFT_7252493 [Phlegmacium glaucopus]|nr:hypothetical protein BYT27DRAFT_7252493 [Phlegmacium glaucopus]